MEKVVTLKYLSLWVLTLLDYYFTKHIIALTDPSIEGNSFLQWAMHRTGTPEVILWIKVFLMISIGVGLFVGFRNHERLKYIDRVLTFVWFIMFVTVCYVGYVWFRIM